MILCQRAELSSVIRLMASFHSLFCCFLRTADTTVVENVSGVASLSELMEQFYTNFLLGVQSTVCITTEIIELHRPLLTRIVECDDSWLDHQLMISAVLHSHRPLFVSLSCLQK